ncbi:phage scaffolding protein [Monoglobus pectinilyticus]|jgi:hypothetical protein|uniref:Phage minor structural protein GP20 n=1 Tax=Monoglobus pectinilyticus TaxID=1981510 RepID=A0A2K9P068_9FIRM|nr:phage scaffolding protein [Monoglobus pectinilyticus]AUO18663.1 phage minor structural protein GP20 [Monoglobus pectinilyticus]
MKREYLKSLELSEEIIDKIMDENGKDVEAIKNKYADYDNIKVQLKEANKQIENFKSMDIDKIKQAADDWKSKFDESEQEHKKQIEKFIKETAIKTAIADKAQDIDIVAKLFDMDKITVDEDGKVSGVDEQLTAMQESKKFLFKTNEVQVDYTPRSGKTKSINPFAKDTFNLTEQGQLLKDDPEKAKALAAEAGTKI